MILVESRSNRFRVGNMKRCFKCNELLPLTEFYTHPQMADGHLGKCKQCAKKDTTERHAERSQDPEWLEKEMERHRIKSRRYRDDGRQAPPSNESKRITNIKYAEKFPEKRRAHTIARRAILAGILIPQPCDRCGTTSVDAHHDDYSKPLDVIWLCRAHHAERHVELRRKERVKIIH